MIVDDDKNDNEDDNDSDDHDCDYNYDIWDESQSPRLILAFLDSVLLMILLNIIDGRWDGPTDRRTHPLLEMRERI